MRESRHSLWALSVGGSGRALGQPCCKSTPLRPSVWSWWNPRLRPGQSEGPAQNCYRWESEWGCPRAGLALLREKSPCFPVDGNDCSCNARSDSVTACYHEPVPLGLLFHCSPSMPSPQATLRHMCWVSLCVGSRHGVSQPGLASREPGTDGLKAHYVNGLPLPVRSVGASWRREEHLSCRW